jgi:N-acetylgalactosamine-N,N'-diacetylbacillosaminyl-diphospho-undecaprenol 4-alpha-N-acetylgalactosaminyltransferase
VTNPKQHISILCISLASGGAEKVISLLLKELKNDYKVTLVLFYNDIHFPIPSEVNLVFLSDEKTNRSSFLRLFNPLVFIKRYNRIIRSENISISVSFLAFPNLVNGVMAMRNKNLKTIISERGFPSDNTSSKTSYYISKLFYPILYNKCDKLFSNSVHINRDLKENFGIKIPMEVIYNPIETPEKIIIPETLNRLAEPLEVITAGTLNKRKNQIMVIRALKEANNNYLFTILGGGNLEDYLRQEINNHNLKDKVILKGQVKQVNKHLLTGDCFVLSSFTEGFPNALLEAMAIGLPCVSTNCLSGPLELLNSNEEINIKNGEFYIAKYGLLVNNDDHIGLSKGLEYFRQNPQERQKYSALSLERAKEYHLDTIYSKFKNFIKS